MRVRLGISLVSVCFLSGCYEYLQLVDVLAGTSENVPSYDFKIRLPEPHKKGPYWEEAEVAFGGRFIPGRVIFAPGGRKFQAGIFIDDHFFAGLVVPNLEAPDGTPTVSFIPCEVSDDGVDFGFRISDKYFVPGVAYTAKDGTYKNKLGDIWKRDGKMGFIPRLDAQLERDGWGVKFPNFDDSVEDPDINQPPCPSPAHDCQPRGKSTGRAVLEAAAAGISAFVGCEAVVGVPTCIEGMVVGGPYACLGYAMATMTTAAAACGKTALAATAVYGMKEMVIALMESVVSMIEGLFTPSQGGGGGGQPTSEVPGVQTTSIGGLNGVTVVSCAGSCMKDGHVSSEDITIQYQGGCGRAADTEASREPHSLEYLCL